MLTSEPKYIYTSDSGLVLGFHGCEESIRDAVVSGNTMLEASTNKYDWLGHGFYFWQNNYDRALDFATNPPSKRKVEKPAVLGAVLSLGSCLDLTDKKNIIHLKRSYNMLEQSASLENRKLPRNKNSKDSKDYILRELDCYVIEDLHKTIQDSNCSPFDSTRGVFIEGSPIYENAGFHEKTHIQICVRNPNCIKGFFIPREEVQWPKPRKLHFIIPDNISVEETATSYPAYLTQ